MRRLILSIATLVCLQSIAQLAAAEDRKLPATARYVVQTNKIASKAIDSELMKHPERLTNFAMKLRYVICRDGRVYNITVVNIEPNAGVEKMALRALRATRFPPIPKDVLREIGSNHIETEVELAYRPAGPTKTSTPTYDEYNLLVHKLLQDQARPVFTSQTRRLEVDYEFYLDPRGRVTELHADAKAGGRWAERAAAESIRAIKFPPVPPKVFKELEQKPPLKIYGTLSWDPNG